MRRGHRTFRYARGSLLGNPINIYIHGTAVLSALSLIYGLLSSGSLNEAVAVVKDLYLARMLPWPLDELLFADTLWDLFFSHVATVSVGVLSASIRYHLSA